MFRTRGHVLQVLLVHPGGPFWKNKEAGAWSIPKGEVEPGEELLAAACREFKEELGLEPTGPFSMLGAVTQKSGKIVHAWAFEGECDPGRIQSNTCEIEWPPRSGKKITIPEIDRAEFFSLEEAEQKINPAQVPLLSLLQKLREQS